MNRQLTLVAQPRARHDNPATAKAAAESVAHGAGYLEAQIAAVVAQCQPVIAEGIAGVLEYRHPGRWTVGTVVTAVSRVAARGLIIPDGTGLTSRGRAATAYRVAP